MKKLIGYLISPCKLYRYVKKYIRLRNLRRTDVLAWSLEIWRYRGLRFGENCIIFPSADILSEPFLVHVGNNVIITGSVKIITHDGSAMLFRSEGERCAVYGSVSIGDNVFIGIGSIILPNTRIGNNVIVGAGSVVRGKVPDDSVVMGNPAKVIYKMSMAKKMLMSSRNYLTASTESELIEKARSCFNDNF